jgi:hypothetical protein
MISSDALVVMWEEGVELFRNFPGVIPDNSRFLTKV